LDRNPGRAAAPASHARDGLISQTAPNTPNATRAVPSTAHDAEAASAAVAAQAIDEKASATTPANTESSVSTATIGANTNTIIPMTASILAQRTRREPIGPVVTRSGASSHESFQRRKSSNCSNRVKLSVSLRLGHHFEHSLTIGLTSIGKKW